MRGYVRQLADEGRTGLVSSHAPSEAEQTADHMLLMAKGRNIRCRCLAAVRAEAGIGCRVRTHPHQSGWPPRSMPPATATVMSTRSRR